MIPPAFPHAYAENMVYLNADHGMTLRDYFAAAALTGIVANPDHSKFMAGMGVNAEQFRKDCTSAVYLYADAMLAERAK